MDSSDVFLNVRKRANSDEPHMVQANLVLAALSDVIAQRKGEDANGVCC